jgi:hypothetical protein
MHKVTSLILQIAMVVGAVYYRVQVVRADLTGAQEEASANVARALELLKQARAAMGGEEALKSLQSLSISGAARRTFQDQNGQAQEKSGKLQLYLMLSGKPGEKMTMKLSAPPEGVEQADRVVIIRRAPAQASSDAGDQAFGAEGQPGKRVMRFNGPHPPMPPAPPPMGFAPVHFLLTSILGAPAPFKIEYSYAGETETEAGGADIVEAKYPGGLVVHLMLDKQTHLPVGMTYRALMPPPMGTGNVIFFNKRIGKDEEAEGVIVPAPEAGHNELPDVLVGPPGTEEEGVEVEGDSTPEKFQIPLPPPQETEARASFSDFRAVNGLLLPHRIMQTFGDKASETWEVEKYEINSPPKFGKLDK